MIDLLEHFSELSALVRKAGEETVAHFNPNGLPASQVQSKGEAGPLTQADLASHRVLVAGVRELFPDVLAVSEESFTPDQAENLPSCFFLIDPLDGTKEYVSGRGEFTVNLALIENGKPLWGLVLHPLEQALYWGSVQQGRAGLDVGGQGSKNIKVAAPGREGLVIAGSRSHANPEALKALLKGQKVKELITVGSSLKFCRVAEGSAQLYPRHGRTMEWDTAAGQAVLEAAGGLVVGMKSGRRLAYGKPGLENPDFLASFAWLETEQPGKG